MDMSALKAARPVEQTSSLVKQALVISSFDAPAFVLDAENITMHFIPPAFFQTKTHLAARSVCETDDSTLQLLPYITLVREGRILMYERGQAGGESRLKGSLSIGFGGHVDSAPPDDTPLIDLLQTEASREVTEETGLTVYPGAIQFTDLIYDPTSDVGIVHLGLHALHVCPTSFEPREEVGHVGKFQWMLPEELMAPNVYDRLENWSKIVAQSLTRKEISPA